MTALNRLRYPLGAALAAVVTLALLLLMHTLIATADRSIDERKPTRIADITMPETRIETNLKAAKPEKIDEPETPPPPVETPELQDFNSNAVAVNMAATPRQQVQIQAGLGMSSSDGEYLPIVKVAAVYPTRALTRAITGYCIVEYTVTTTGATRDPRPIDCQPQGIFEDASVKAALKFKYKPRVIDGQPVEVAGVKNRFLYELEN
jgi:protein TonB